MLAKFNFYDIVGYLIPGGATVALLYWLGMVYAGWPVPGPGFGIGDATVFLAVSYFAGHLVQAAGHGLERRLFKTWPSEQLLTPGNAGFSPAFVKVIRDSAIQTFKLPPDGIKPNEIFDLCYALTVQTNSAAHIEIFLGINGLSRGIVIASRLGAGASLLVLIHGLFRGDHGQALLAAALAILFVVADRLSLAHLKSFAWTFARSVYENFVAWSARQLKAPTA